MPAVSIVSPSMPGKSVKQASCLTSNWYTEKDQSGVGFSQLIAMPTPGMTLWSTNSGNAHRPGGAILTSTGQPIWIIDAGVYLGNTNGTLTIIGQLNTSTGYVSMARGNNFIVIVDGVNGYFYETSNSTFSQINDTNFPNGCKYVTFKDGYWVFMWATIDQLAWGVSPINDPRGVSNGGSAYDPSQTTEVSADANPIQAVFSNAKYLFIFTHNTIEVWNTSGTGSTFPYSRVDTYTQWIGTAAPGSIALGKDNVYWLAQTKSGQGQIYMLQASLTVQTQRIDNPAIAYRISQLSTVSDALGFVQEENGHEFYILTFPTAQETWVFDLQTGSFHQRTSYLPGLNPAKPFNRYLPNNYVFYNGMHLVGDCSSGNIYYLDQTNYTENGNPIERLLVSPVFHLDSRRNTISNLEVEMEPGQGTTSGQGEYPKIELSVSRDGGFLYGNWLSRSIGMQGQYKLPIIWGRLGSAKSIVFRLRLTDPVKAVILAARADIFLEDIGFVPPTSGA